jgi:predicted RNase H-like HicB family nuclease
MSYNQEFYVIIERDEDGYYVGEVPQLKGCGFEAVAKKYI